MIEIKDGDCLYNLKVDSFKIHGKFCKAKINDMFIDVETTNSNLFWGKGYVKKIVLHDSSPQLILAKGALISSKLYETFGNYHICTPNEIDTAENIEDFTSSRVGIALQPTAAGDVEIVYSYGVEKNSDFKGSWCCQDGLN
ncbi:hypothetical protein MHBO_001098 [Bonamia ostreae]|uniref:Uncharacterized protein n=1 Tax=Bonamia ostreae TaxID=126728 RepID=A0ABV2AIB3_9EUKA